MVVNKYEAITLVVSEIRIKKYVLLMKKYACERLV